MLIYRVRVKKKKKKKANEIYWLLIDFISTRL